MSVLSVCMLVYHVNVRRPWRPEKYTRLPRTGAKDGESCHVRVGDQTWVPWKSRQHYLPRSLLSSTFLKMIFIVVYCLEVLQIEPRISHSLGKLSTTELDPRPSFNLLFWDRISQSFLGWPWTSSPPNFVWLCEFGSEWHDYSCLVGCLGQLLHDGWVFLIATAK